MASIIDRLATYRLYRSFREFDCMCTTVDEMLRKYGFENTHQFYYDKMYNDYNGTSVCSTILFSSAADILSCEADENLRQQIKRLGVKRLVYKALLTKRYDGYNLTGQIAVEAFLDALQYHGRTHDSTMRYEDFLWYVNYRGRLSYVPKGLRKSRAEKLLKDKRIEFDDRIGFYKATEPIDNMGATEMKRHRAIIDALSNDRWTDTAVDLIASYLDGVHEVDMVIDTDFASAYAPVYHYGSDSNKHGDLVTGESCMSERPDDAQEFYGGINGCYVCRFLNDRGENVGRCIMYEYNGRRHFIRIYAQTDYQESCYVKLKAQMKEGDVFGRDEWLDGLCLSTTWDSSTPCMYLDGNHYAVGLCNGELCIVNEDDYGTLVPMSTTSRYMSVYDEIASESDYRICEQCGEWYDSSYDGFEIDDCYYCSSSCAEDAGFVKCEECGEYVRRDDAITTGDGVILCSERCAEVANYVKCARCGEWYYYENCIETKDTGRWYCCDECAANDGCTKCDFCGDWYAKKIYPVGRKGKMMCEDCAFDKNYELRWSKKDVKEENND